MIYVVEDHRTEYGVMIAERLFKSKFTDIHPMRPEGNFRPAQIDSFLPVLRDVWARVAA